MNYGKKSVSKKRNSLISRTAMMGKRAHVSLIRVLFVALITICVVIGCTGIGAFRGIIDNAPDANDIDISPLGYATFLYDGDGNQLRKLTAPSSNRLPVSIDQIPLDLQHAVVAIEDERFYEHNGIDVDPRSIFDCQVKRLHEYKRQLMNILHVMYLYNEIKAHPDMDIVPRTFIFGAKAAAGYYTAKLTIKLINAVADKINNDPSINGKIKVVFIEDYRVSNAELIFAAADVSEQISTASKEASGTGNMKFMLNGALTLGTMDGANVEIVEEVGKENAFIFGLSADQVMEYEKNGNYNPRDVYNNNQDVRQVLTQLVNGFYSPENPELFRALYDALLEKDTYFTLLDFDSYKEAHNRIDAAYRDEEHWARTAMLQTASAGKFSSDRTIEEYAKEMWHLEKVTL